jgi:hypothetical protein
MFSVALDVLREAASRRWFLALFLGITALLGAVGLSLRVEVVDGALAATRLFGEVMSPDIVPVDVALRPVFQAAAYVLFYGGLVFGIVACSDFGPSMLAPGRIEHLLALPVRRHELLLGTFLGVLALAVAGAIYGAGGMVLILGTKTGVFTVRPLLAGLLAASSFAAIYAAMLASAVVVRSAAVSAVVGGALAIAGAVASYRSAVLDALEPGVGRTAFSALSLLVPRISAIADAGAKLAGSHPVDGAELARLVAGVLIFGASVLAAGVFHLEGKDF